LKRQKKQDGKVLEIPPLCLRTKIEDVAGKMPLALMGVPDLSLWRQGCEMAAHRGCVPLGKSCIPSSNEYNSRIGLEDRLGQVDTLFSFADSVL
jgi:hypothetical protein